MRENLGENYPALVQQWADPDLSPYDYTAGSKVKPLWKCERGHTWRAAIKNRVNGQDCPYCAGRYVLPGFNDAAHTHPELLQQWVDTKILPTTVGAHSHKKVEWECEQGHRWRATVGSRVAGRGCPVCARKIVVSGINDVATTDPEIAKSWADPDLSPYDYTAGSQVKPLWKCERGHTWRAPIYERVSGGGCPYCSGRRVLKGFNDLATINPEKAARWVRCVTKPGLSPVDVTVSSGVIVEWECGLGHRWMRRVCAREEGCPYCSGRKVLEGFNDLATVDPALSKQMVSPMLVTQGSNKKVEWECDLGHRWMSTVSDRSRGQGCPRCCHHVSRAETDLADFIQSVLEGADVFRNVRDVIPPKELDIYIPSKNIAVEFNGLWWHSDAVKEDKNHHYDKWRACADKGIQLITVWEDDWRDHPDVVKSMLRHKLGVDHSRKVGARSCEIVDVSPVDARSFLGTHHIQGDASGSVRIGLRDSDGTLVAVCVLRRRHGKEWELLRYATSINVMGGQSRLLSVFIREYSPVKIVTFSDHEVSDGNLYARTGWTKDAELAPDYKYVYRGKRCHKFGFRKERFRKDPVLLWDPGMTEHELAVLNGIPRTWDCGKTRWVRVCR